jgi:HEPN superfamily protein
MTSMLKAVGAQLPSHPGTGPDTEIARPRPRASVTVLKLLESARRGLAEAAAESDPGTRYICAHLAALRAAAAIVGARGEPGTGSRRRRPRSVWELLPQVEPTLGEWAAFFAASASKRAAAEAGLLRAASAHEADDLLRDATTFLSVAEHALGVESQLQLPLRPAS